MSHANKTTDATKSEPTGKQCIGPEDTPTNANTTRTKKRKRDDAVDHQKGFITHLVQTTRRKLSALRRPPTPRCPASNPKVPQRARTTMLMSVGQQPAVALEPPLWAAATTPHLTTASSQYLPWSTGNPGTRSAGGGQPGARKRLRLAPELLYRPLLRGSPRLLVGPQHDGDSSVSHDIRWSHVPEHGRGAREASGDGDINVSPKDKGREVLSTSGSPTVAPYKQPSLPQPEEATPTLVVKPLSPQLRSPPLEDNKHVTPYSLGGYPLGSDAQGTYDNAQDKDHTEEEEMHGGCNNVACIVLIVWERSRVTAAYRRHGLPATTLEHLLFPSRPHLPALRSLVEFLDETGIVAYR
ncbi:hypothetical protein HPB51_008771 [Rhipicephalus microplus]|uniref:Uncharacterized protein n=1 Tax=Rhipicephalus microplus TaxID=6941 RepID=A0A9J6EGZ4_RHIMP|nr:hypothetical protein HPB51_028899 [Rhipicephalus microplus]KAH8033288.1 hypothetical protein HPB51_008771 [Rhipicephalus microplus]